MKLIAQALEGLPVPQSWGSLALLAGLLALLFGREWGRALIAWWRQRRTRLLEAQAEEQEWYRLEAEEARRRADTWTARYIDRLERENADARAELEQLRAKVRETRHLLEHRGLEELSEDLHLADVAQSDPGGDDA